MEPEALKAAQNLRKLLQQELGPAWDHLIELFSERGADIDRICNNYVRVTDPNDRFQHSFCRSLWTWGATVQHHAYRLELIDLLIDARDGILDSMRVIPVPSVSLASTESRDESLGPAGVLLPPHIDDLNDTQQAILAELDKERLTCPQLAVRVRKSKPAVKKALETLRRFGSVEFIPGGGYIIRVRPRGMPPKPGTVSDPSTGVSG
jgi:hypothetical protein